MNRHQRRDLSTRQIPHPLRVIYRAPHLVLDLVDVTSETRESVALDDGGGVLVRAKTFACEGAEWGDEVRVGYLVAVGGGVGVVPY